MSSAAAQWREDKNITSRTVRQQQDDKNMRVLTTTTGVFSSKWMSHRTTWLTMEKDYYFIAKNVCPHTLHSLNENINNSHFTLLTLKRFIHKQYQVKDSRQGKHDQAAWHWLRLGTGSITLKGMLLRKDYYDITKMYVQTNLQLERQYK